MFRNVSECSGMFHVPDFIDAPSFAGADNEQAVDNFNFFATTIFRPTCMFTDKEDSGRGIMITTRKFTRGIKQESKNTTKHEEVNYMSSWSTRGWDDWLKKGTFLPQLRKFVNVAQKKR